MNSPLVRWMITFTVVFLVISSVLGILAHIFPESDGAFGFMYTVSIHGLLIGSAVYGLFHWLAKLVED